MNVGVRWALGVGLAVAAWAVISVTPDHREHTADPIAVPAAIGQSVDVSGLTVTVTDAHLTDGVEVPDGQLYDGRWVVVDVSVLADDSDLGDPLGGVSLRLDDALITSSDIVSPLSRIDAFPLRTGLVVSGSLLFQLSSDAPLGEATILLGRRDRSDIGVWSDDQAQLVIDLGTMPLETDLSFDAPTVRAP